MTYATRDAYREAWDNAYTYDPPVPLNLDIELASTCNAKCTFCLYGDRDWFEDMKKLDWDGKTKKRFMPEEMAIGLISGAARLGIPAIKFNFRGESTLHKDFSKILKLARCYDSPGLVGGYKYEKFHDLLVNTNGNCPEAALDGLMAATKVMVSLDSMDSQIYPKVRVGLSLDKVIGTIDELVKRGHPNLWVRRVICKENQSEDFIGAVKSRWPNGVKSSEHFAFDRNHYQSQEIVGEDHTKWPRTYCGYPSQRIVVEASGKYVPCCIAWEGEFDAGTYPALSLKDYWASEWRRNLANELRQGIFRNDKCRNCTSYMSFKRPERNHVQDVEGRASISWMK